MQWGCELVILYINVALYSLCSQLQKPIEPFLVKALDGDDHAFGWYLLIYNVAQTIGAPILGCILEKYGARIGCVIVFLSSALSYGLLGCSTSLWIMYLSKVPTAFQHAFLVAQTMIAQTIAEEDRARALGLLMATFQIGAAIGPLVGGVIGQQRGYYFGSWLAVAGSLVSIGLTLVPILRRASSSNCRSARTLRGRHRAADGQGEVCLQEMEGMQAEQVDEHEACSSERQQEESEADARLPFKEGVARVLASPIIIAILCTKFLSSVSNSFFEGASPLILSDSFNMTECEVGGAMSVRNGFSAMSGALLVGPVTRKFSASHLVTLCLVWMILCYIGLSLASPGAAQSFVTKNNVAPPMPFVSMFVILAGAAFALGTGLTTLSTSNAEDALKVTVVGLEHGVFSLARVGAPSLGILCLESFGSSGLCLVCGCLIALVLILWRSWAVPRLQQAIPKPAEENELALQAKDPTENLQLPNSYDWDETPCQGVALNQGGRALLMEADQNEEV